MLKVNGGIHEDKNVHIIHSIFIFMAATIFF